MLPDIRLLIVALFSVSSVCQGQLQISADYDPISHMIHVHLTGFRDIDFSTNQEQQSKPFRFLGGDDTYIRMNISSESFGIGLITLKDENPLFKVLAGIVFERHRISARDEPEIKRTMIEKPSTTKGKTGYACTDLCKVTDLNKQTDEEIFHIRPVFNGRWARLPSDNKTNCEYYLWEILHSDLALLKRGGLGFKSYFEPGHYIEIGNFVPFGSSTAQLSFWANQDAKPYKASEKYKKVALFVCRAGGRYEQLHSMTLSGARAQRYRTFGQTGLNCLDRFDEASGQSNPQGMTACFKVEFNISSPDSSTSQQIELQPTGSIHSFTAHHSEGDATKVPDIFDLTAPRLTVTTNDVASVIHLQLLNFKHLQCGEMIQSKPFELNSCPLKIGIYPRGTAANPDQLIMVVYSLMAAEDTDQSLTGFCANHQRLTARNSTQIHQQYAKLTPVALTDGLTQLAEVALMPVKQVYYNSNHEEFTVRPVLRAKAARATTQQQNEPFSTTSPIDTAIPDVYSITVNRTLLAMAKRGLFFIESEQLGDTGLSLYLGNNSKTSVLQNYTHCTVGLWGESKADKTVDISYLTGTDESQSETHLWETSITKQAHLDKSNSHGRITKLLDDASGHDVTIVVRVSLPKTVSKKSKKTSADNDTLSTTSLYKSEEDEKL